MKTFYPSDVTDEQWEMVKDELATDFSRGADILVSIRKELFLMLSSTS